MTHLKKLTVLVIHKSIFLTLFYFCCCCCLYYHCCSCCPIPACCSYLFFFSFCWYLFVVYRFDCLLFLLPLILLSPVWRILFFAWGLLFFLFSPCADVWSILLCCYWFCYYYRYRGCLQRYRPGSPTPCFEKIHVRCPILCCKDYDACLNKDSAAIFSPTQLGLAKWK